MEILFQLGGASGSAVKIQLSVVYLTTAVMKASYPEWRDGTSMIFVMISEFSRFPDFPWGVSKGFGVLAAHSGGSQLHRFIDFQIAGAAADVPRQSQLDLLARGGGFFLQQCLCRQQERRSAVSALSRAKLGECLL